MLFKKLPFFNERHILKCNLSNSSLNAQFLSDAFDLTYYQAKRYLDRNRLTKKEPETLRESVSFCRKCGYSDEDILSNPKLLSTQRIEVYHHYLALEETGLKRVYPMVLAKARSYMKRSIAFLKKTNILDREVDVGRNFASYLDIPPSESTLSCLKDDLRWNEVHKYILQEYLKNKLEATEDDIFRLFRIHHQISNKSFRVIQENIQIARDLDFPLQKIIRCGYLLHNYPEYPKVILRDFNNIAGIDIRQAMKHYPKIIMTSPKNIAQIYGILKEFNISDDLIKNTPSVFQLTPETVRFRLEEINRIPELKVLLKHPKILRLVVHHKKATSRLSFLQQLQLKCASLALLASGFEEPFNNHIRARKDINQSSDVAVFLKNLFNEDSKKLLQKIKLHPFHLQVPLLDMQETFDFLISRKFHRSSIIEAVYVILYPKEKVEKALRDMLNQNYKEHMRLNQVKKLNLTLYYLEKEHNFTGNGVWRISNSLVEIPEKTLE